MTGTPRVFRNDWSSVSVPDLDGWRPELTVSVMIPAFQCQATLDVTLASLGGQTYPTHLLEVVVVDDGSDPPLSLPPIRPLKTTLVRVEDGWGRANALRWGVAHSSGEILHWLDADMVAYPEHVAAQVRWQHVLPYAVTLGYKRFVDPAVHRPWPTPASVEQAWGRGAAADLFGGAVGDSHDYVERYIAQTDGLRTADHLAFRIHVGATAAVRRELYDMAGGFDPRLRLGEDIEFGYRLSQAGAVFVPEPRARSWHLGRTQVMRAQAEVARYNGPFIANRVPYPRHWRKVGGTAWSVPLVEVAMAVAEEPLERVQAAVDSVLHGTEQDVRVNLVGPWDRIDDGRVAEPSDLVLIAASYRSDPRVRLVTAAPTLVFSTPYLLNMPVAYGLAPDAIRHLIDLADYHQAGVVRVRAPAGGRHQPVLLWRTAAIARARWVRSDGESLLDAVTSVYGSREVTAETIGVADLARFAPDALTHGFPGRSARRRNRWIPSTVEVIDARTLATATLVVARQLAKRLRATVRTARPDRDSRLPG